MIFKNTEILKSICILFPVAAGLLLGCSGGTDNSDENQTISQDQTEEIQQSSKEFQRLVDSADTEIDSLQKDIDELLSDI